METTKCININQHSCQRPIGTQQHCGHMMSQWFGSYTRETGVYTRRSCITILKELLMSLTFLRLLFSRGLRCHVDGGSSHADGAAAWDQVELHGLPGDEGGCHLHLLRQAQVGAETRHEVSGGDEVHARLQGLQDEFKAAANLLLRNPGHSADFWNRRNYRECQC